MSDVRRVVTLMPGGQAIVVLDLEDAGGGIVCERDTWKITPPVSRPRSVSSERPYQGATTVGLAHDNGAVGATWRVKSPNGSADEAIGRWSSFISACNSAAVGRHIEWRPDGASSSRFYGVRGPATWNLTYSWVQFSQLQSISVEAQWPVGPLALLPQMDVFDDFSLPTAGDYRFDDGSFA